MGTGRQGPCPYGGPRRGQRPSQHKLTLSQQSATELTAVKGTALLSSVPAARAWLLCRLDGYPPLGKAQQPLFLKVGLLVPGRLFFHCFNLHTSPGGSESGSVSLVTAEAQNGEGVCRVKQ